MSPSCYLFMLTLTYFSCHLLAPLTTLLLYFLVLLSESLIIKVMSKLVPIGKQGHQAIVDDEDYQAVIDAGPWYCLNNGLTIYARNIKGVYLHRFIMNPPKDMVVDHIDHNGLDVRKNMLKVCTHSENQKNVRPYKKFHNRGTLQKGLL